MATINIPNTRTGNTVVGHVRLKDGSMLIPWSGFSDIRVDAYSVEQRMLAARCAASIDAEDGLILNVTYSGDSPQYLGLCKLIVRGVYGGRRKTYDCFFVNFVAETAEATGVTVVTDPEVDVLIDVQEVSTSVLDEAIAAALAAADKAEHTASLAPYIDETTGTWWVYNPATDQYEDSGVEARGPQGISPIEFGEGTNSAVQGRTGATATGWGASAFGSETIAEGNDSHAEGDSSQAIGDASHAEGTSTEATGESSHAEGNSTVASGVNSHAEGESNHAQGPSSHAEGDNTEASGYDAHSEGGSTTADGDYAHAEGLDTTASGTASHAEGNDVQALGEASHAEGSNTEALHDYEHAQGFYNESHGDIEHPDHTIHSVGVGEDGVRMNAEEILRDGAKYLLGIGGYDGTNPYDSQSVQQVLETFITRSVNNLINYYTKSETYTQAQVNELIGAINQFHYETYASLSDITNPQGNVLYLIGPSGTGSDRYEEYVYASGNFVKIGDTTIDLSGYVTITALNQALALKQDVIADLETIRSGAAAGATAYQKPAGGIPKAHLASDVKTSLDKADSALQPEALEPYAKKDGYYEQLSSGSAKTLEGIDPKVEDFTFTPISCADGLAKLNGVRGKSLVWNQLAKAKSNSLYDVTATAGDNGVVSISGTASNSATLIITDDFSVAPNHKYLIKGGTASMGLYITGYSSVKDTGNGVIVQTNASDSERRGVGFGIVSGTSYSGNLIPICIDLTLMFGVGKEPSTVAEFERWYYLKYYAFNPGSILNNKTAQVESVGFNQWDEEWEVGGISETTGGNIPAQSVRSKNYIPVIAGSNYFFKVRYAGTSGIYIKGYDANKTVIDSTWLFTNVSNAIKTIPSGVSYIRFMTLAGYGTTYNHDICINLSDPTRNGQYEPYKKVTIDLNLTTITGKKVVNGSTEGQGSVVVYPDGMRGVGDKYDEAHGSFADHKFAEVDLGDLSWQLHSGGLFFMATLPQATIAPATTAIVPNVRSSKYGTVTPYDVSQGIGDKELSIGRDGVSYTGYCIVRDTAYSTAADFKAAMNGVKLIYQLATPEEYVLDTPLPETFQAYKGGTLKQLPENTSEPTTAPCVLEVTYALDAVGILTGLPQNYISKESLAAMLSAMQSAGIFAGYTMTWNATTGKYEFTFTANS